ncbi:nucleotidyl transferase AbiEii/AbiGii toxin family protein [Massilia sp. CF038]|uniref:nucleotidyl transferase AbiEii/AbiGii toxin family protein n=1 Tax=Massilia sp. CF038 TaxID=1881045 RepID=UPI0009198DD1|nr:nucleotidyl transferase AbiEii/AbiGii toxin family protein [Massilia sp. CF038]SHH40489.1 Predicted nucleotidyltransferase [Massilia sp. CF038]
MATSIRPERPLDPILLQVLRAVAEEAARAGIEYMLVGATARDILLTHVFGLPAGRATYDVDFAVAVASWAQFERLKTGISARPGFTLDYTAAQRLYYKEDASPQRYPLDLVPFGAIAGEQSAIVWPPDMAVVMSVIGYEDVLASAEEVEFAPGLVGRVASLPGLAVLKLIAWSDRGRGNPKDAHDLLQLMNNYAAAGNEARLYDAEYSLLEAADHDPDLAGACLLGKDVARLVKDETRAAIIELIDGQRDLLIRAMAGAIRHSENAQERVEARFQQFRNGLSLV